MGTVTIGANDYEIYGTLTTDAGDVYSATNYLAGSLNASAWDDATADNKARALVTATRIFDKQKWAGSMTDPDTPQPLAWPRTGVTDCEGNAVSDSVIPTSIIYGAYELALAILNDSAVQTAASAGSNVKRTSARDKVGDLETAREYEYFTPTSVAGGTAGRFPPQVQELVRCYLGNSTSGLYSVTIEGAEDSFFAGRDYSWSGNGIP